MSTGVGLFQLVQLLAASPQAAGLSGCTGCSPSPNILQQLAGAAQSGACAQVCQHAPMLCAMAGPSLPDAGTFH